MASSFPKDYGTVEPYPNHHYLPLKVMVSPVNIYFYLNVRFFFRVTPPPFLHVWDCVIGPPLFFIFVCVILFFINK